MLKDIPKSLRNFPFLMVLFLGISFLVSAFLIKGSSILHLWESLYFYHAFGSKELHGLSFWASPGGNMGMPGYGAIEAIRYALVFFNLNINLESFRLVSILPSFVYLAIFYRYCERRVGKWASAFTTISMSLNPLFHAIQHSATVVMISLMSLGLLIEFTDNMYFSRLNRNDRVLKAIGFLSIAIVLCIPHYGITRILSVVILTGWVLSPCRFIQFKKKGDNPKFCRYILRRLFTALTASSLASLIMTVLDRRNLFILLNPREFFLPSRAETIFNSLYSEITVSFTETVLTNTKVVFESFIGLGGHYHAPSSGYYSADLLYYIGQPYMFIPFVIGIFTCLFRQDGEKKGNTIHFTSRKSSALSLLVLSLIPCILSGVFFYQDPYLDQEMMMITLHSTRLIYTQFSYYALVAIGIAELVRFTPRSLSSSPLIACVGCFLIFGQFIRLNLDSTSFSSTISRGIKHLSTANKFDLTKIYFSNFSNGFRTHPHNAEHIFLHSVYISIAEKISKNISANNKSASNPAFIHVYFVDMDRLDDGKGTSPPMLQYLQDHSYHSLFLSLYISQIINQRFEFVQIYNASPVLSYMGFTEPREYPLRGKRYPDNLSTASFKRRNLSTSGHLHGILATNHDELSYLINSLRKGGVKFVVNEIPIPTPRKLISFYD